MEFEVKNKCKKCERSKGIVILSLFERSKLLFSTGNRLNKVVIVGGSRNAEGLGAEHPAAGGKLGVGGVDFYCFVYYFSKNTHF